MPNMTLGKILEAQERMFELMRERKLVIDLPSAFLNLADGAHKATNAFAGLAFSVAQHAPNTLWGVEFVAGIKIVESEAMTKTIEDWSKVRSPSRARRRMRRGYKQNIIIRIVPRTDAVTTDGGKTFIVHPQAARALRQRMKLELDKSMENALWGR